MHITHFPGTGSAVETSAKFVALPFQNAVLCSSCQCFHPHSQLPVSAAAVVVLSVFIVIVIVVLFIVVVVVVVVDVVVVVVFLN